MDINSQQLINTFIGGMNTDTSDNLLENNQYRYAENLRLVTNTDSNSGELRLVEGTELFIDSGDRWDEILKMINIRDYVVLITRRGRTWSIYKFKHGSTNLKQIFGPCETPLWDSIDTINLSVIGNYESEENIKLYIADGIHELMCINVSKEPEVAPTDLNTILGYKTALLPPLEVSISQNSGQLTAAKVQYAYRMYSKYGAATRLSPLSHVLSLYKDAEQGYAQGAKTGRAVTINMPDANFGTPDAEDYYTDGELQASLMVDGYNKDGNDRKMRIRRILVYNNFEDNPELQQTTNTFFVVDTLSTRDLLTSPLSVNDILRAYYNKEPLLDRRNTVYTTVDSNPIWLDEGLRILVVLIGTENDKYKCSNVFEITYDNIYSILINSDKILNELLTDLRVNIDSITLNKYPLRGLEENTNTSSISISDVLDSIQIFRINYVENGQLPTVSIIYDGKYKVGDTIIDAGQKEISTLAVSELLTYTQVGIIPKVIETKHNYLFAASVKYSQEEIDKNFKNLNLEDYFEFIPRVSEYSYKLDGTSQDDNYSSQHSSFRPGETYRFGIIFYDEKGNRSSVFHYKDITIEDYSLFNWLNIDGKLEGGKIYKPLYNVKPIVIEVKLKKELENCSRYEIVRCLRSIENKRTITQGLVGRVLQKAVLDSDVLKYENRLSTPMLLSMGYYDEDSSNLYSLQRSASSKNILQFASPEYVYLSDDIKDILKAYKSSISITTAFNYIPYLKIEEIENDVATWDYMAGQYRVMPFPDNNINKPFAFVRYKDSYLYAIQSGKNISSNTLMAIKYTRNNVTGYIYFNTLYPYTFITPSDPQYSHQTYKIQDTAFVDSPDWDSFASQESLLAQDAVVPIGEYMYTKWSNINISKDDFTSNDNVSRIKNSNYLYSWTPIGTAGSSILMKTSSEISGYEEDEMFKMYGPFVITVADITKDPVPYGKHENSTYCSFGDVFINETGSNILTSGDCYIRMFKYNALHNWFDTTFVALNKAGTVYCVPMFMDIDLHGQYGSTYNSSLNKGYYIQDKASSFDGYTQLYDAYLYNTAYNSNPDIIQFSGREKDVVNVDYDTRVHYSEQKTNNENIDNWTTFKAMNFLDVDSKYGEITDLKLFKNKLLFWLNEASGILAVNERVVLSDANDTQVILGTGSVLDRYDYISTVYGMKDRQHTACISNDALYWWDGNNKEILQYTDKYSVVPLTQTKNIRNYVNERIENSKPHLYYNRKYKEIICQCVHPEGKPEESVVYNELLQRFISVYTAMGYTPIADAYVNDTLYITNGKNIYTAAADSDTSKLFENKAFPYISYMVNTNNTLGKTYDIQIIGGNLYLHKGNGTDRRIYVDNLPHSILVLNNYRKSVGVETLFLNQPDPAQKQHVHEYYVTDPLKCIQLRYRTSLNQQATVVNGEGITNREYDYRLNIPRESSNTLYGGDYNPTFGGRLRGKTMQCELWSTSNSTDFSLQYITTKYRMSWS